MKPEPESDDLFDKLEECLERASSTLGHNTFDDAKRQEKLTKDLSSSIHPIVQRMQKGMSQILEFLTSPATHDPFLFSEEVTQQLCQIAAIASVMSDNPKEYLILLARDKSLQEIFGLTDETMEKLYQAAKFIYEQQHYQESAAAFSVLSVISPFNHTFWVGYGNSEYFCQNYQAALIAYAMAAQANPHDPMCHFFSAHCYEALRQKDHAINSLELAILTIQDNQAFASWKQKAIEHKQRLSKSA